MSNSLSSPLSSSASSSKRSAHSVPRPLQLKDVSCEPQQLSGPLGNSNSDANDTWTSRRNRYSIHSPMRSPSVASDSSRPQSARRQSSIAYFSAAQDAPRSPLGGPSLSRPSDNRPRSFDALATDASRKLLRRSSLRPEQDARAPSATASPSAPDQSSAPLTLVEKNADLLNFIAQKEAKCMELRTQLATEEAELSRLKQKWERIIGRKLTQASGLGLAGPLPSDASTSNGSAAMLDGLKEGVQGAARLLVAGLADLSSVSPITIAAPSPSNLPNSKPKDASSHQPASSPSSRSTSPSPLFSRSSTSSLDTSGGLDKDVDNVAATPVSATDDYEGVVESSARRKANRPGMRQRRSVEEPKSASTIRVTSSSPSPTPPMTPQPVSIPHLLDDLADPASTPPIADWVKRKWAAADGPNQLRDANRRASLLLADVGQRGQSWLASFSPAGTTTFSQLDSSQPAHSGEPSPVGSLLDDDIDDPWAAAEAGSVLIPDTPKAASAHAEVERPQTSLDDFGAWASGPASVKVESSLVTKNDDDDWNW